VTADQIIHEIATLPPDEQAKIVRFAYQLNAERRLSGEELSGLAERMPYRLSGCITQALAMVNSDETDARTRG
jgi:hypothetical protein